MWSEEDIKSAKAHCSVVLRGVDATIVEDDPIKEGECGSPVVYKLSSVGKGPAVELSPPVLLTCEMVATLDKWMKQDVQPRARALLGSPIIKIETMSSYSCRNAYGRTKARLSEHGKANAIDIGGFGTAKDSANVLASWGLTNRDLKALAAKQEAERAAAAAAAAAAKAREAGYKGGSNSIGSVSPPTVALPGTTIAPIPGAGRSFPATGLGYAPPSQLGGPKGTAQQGTEPVPSQASVVSNDPKRRFLRDIHESACKHFGTVLGPEANNAHRNHFHLDMAARRLNNFCE